MTLQDAECNMKNKQVCVNPAMQIEYSAADLERALQRDRKARRKFARQLSQSTGQDYVTVHKILCGLSQVLIQQLQTRGRFCFHKLVTFKVKRKPARAASVKQICGREVVLRALPAHNHIQCAPTRSLSAAVEHARSEA